MGPVWRRCVVVSSALLIAALVGTFATAVSGRGRVVAHMMQSAEVAHIKRADVAHISTVHAAPAGPCFVSGGGASSQACGELACTEFIDDVTPQAPGPVPDGSMCQRITTPVVRARPMLVRSSAPRSAVAIAPWHGTLRARMRVLVRALSG
jgi:hypothetical protein